MKGCRQLGLGIMCQHKSLLAGRSDHSIWGRLRDFRNGALDIYICLYIKLLVYDTDPEGKRQVGETTGIFNGPLKKPHDASNQINTLPIWKIPLSEREWGILLHVLLPFS